MTDVTGLGLLGHLRDMAVGSGLGAEIDYAAVPKIDNVERYIAAGAVPGGTHRNWDSYGSAVADLPEAQRLLLCDPQTSGGLLVAVDPAHRSEFEAVLADLQVPGGTAPIGIMGAGEARIRVV